jgi:hypothetical protein
MSHGRKREVTSNRRMASVARFINSNWKNQSRGAGCAGRDRPVPSDLPVSGALALYLYKGILSQVRLNVFGSPVAVCRHPSRCGRVFGGQDSLRREPGAQQFFALRKKQSPIVDKTS